MSVVAFQLARLLHRAFLLLSVSCSNASNDKKKAKYEYVYKYTHRTRDKLVEGVMNLLKDFYCALCFSVGVLFYSDEKGKHVYKYTHRTCDQERHELIKISIVYDLFFFRRALLQ